MRGKQHHHGGDVCDCCVCSSRYFSYYSFRRNPTAREFFVPAGTLIAAKLLITIIRCLITPMMCKINPCQAHSWSKLSSCLSLFCCEFVFLWWEVVRSPLVRVGFELKLLRENKIYTNGGGWLCDTKNR